MEIEIINTYQTLESLKPEWQHLLTLDSNHTIFQTPEWILSCYKYFEQDFPLFVVTARENSSLIGLAPFIIKKTSYNGIIRKVLTFVASQGYLSDYIKPIIADGRTDVLREIFKSVFKNTEWEVCDLFNITSSAKDQITEIQKLAKELKLKTYRYDQIATPAVIIASEADEKKLLSHSSQKRHTRYFQREGNLRIENLTNFSDIVNLLPDFFTQHINQWNESLPSLFLDERQKNFYLEVAEQLCNQNALLFTVVYFNHKAIAYHFGFHYKDVLYWYKPSYDISLSKHSPGEVLQLALFEYAVEHNVKKFDFTIGEEKFKYRFANEITYNERLLIYRYSLDYFLQYCRKLFGSFRHLR